MSIRYVVSSMLFWWRENHLSFEQECEFLNAQGFGIELWATLKDQDECRYGRRNWSRLQGATEGMLVSLNSRKGDPTLDQWKEQIECAREVGATSIVVDLKSLGIPEGVELNGCDFSEAVIGFAEENNVKLCLETGPLDKLIQIGKRFESIWYCLDTGYANLDGGHPFEEYVDKLAPRIAYLHLSDNYGRKDDHEPPGLRGGISNEKWEYLLASLRKHDNDVIASLEMRPSMPAVMLRKAGEFLFDDLKWPDRPEKRAGSAAISYNPI